MNTNGNETSLMQERKVGSRLRMLAAILLGAFIGLGAGVLVEQTASSPHESIRVRGTDGLGRPRELYAERAPAYVFLPGVGASVALIVMSVLRVRRQGESEADGTEIVVPKFLEPLLPTKPKVQHVHVQAGERLHGPGAEQS